MSGAANPYGAPGASPVGRRRTQLSPLVRIGGTAACVAVVAGLVAWTAVSSRTGNPSKAPERAFTMGVDLPEPSMPRAAAPAPLPTPIVAHVETAASPPISPVASAKPFAFTVWEAPADVTNAAEQANAMRELARRTRQAGTTPGGSDPGVATPGGSEFAQRMRHTAFADTEPLPHRFHVQYTIRKGTVFPCTPAQPIASDLPGPVRCTADDNVWSMDGTTVLLPKGTQINGTIEKGLGTGEDRLFIIWTDALTPAPDLLAIPLEAPAADELGQSGAPGDVDTHLWQRIKAALLLSLVDIAGNAASAAATTGSRNTVLNLGPIGGNTSSLGQMAFGHDLNIPPTLYRAQGQPLTVYVPSYIDLVHFYQDVPVSRR